jgi:hypothetical protein
MKKARTATQVKKSFRAGMRRAAKKWGKARDKIMEPYYKELRRLLRKYGKA